MPDFKPKMHKIRDRVIFAISHGRPLTHSAFANDECHVTAFRPISEAHDNVFYWFIDCLYCIDLFSYTAASLFNKLTFLLTHLLCVTRAGNLPPPQTHVPRKSPSRTSASTNDGVVSAITVIGGRGRCRGGQMSDHTCCLGLRGDFTLGAWRSTFWLCECCISESLLLRHSSRPTGRVSCASLNADFARTIGTSRCAIRNRK